MTNMKKNVLVLGTILAVLLGTSFCADAQVRPSPFFDNSRAQGGNGNDFYSGTNDFSSLGSFLSGDAGQNLDLNRLFQDLGNIDSKYGLGFFGAANSGSADNSPALHGSSSFLPGDSGAANDDGSGLIPEQERGGTPEDAFLRSLGGQLGNGPGSQKLPGLENLMPLLFGGQTGTSSYDDGSVSENRDNFEGGSVSDDVHSPKDQMFQNDDNESSREETYPDDSGRCVCPGD